uniref:TNF family profile domain-containing protein n=1 Tax=Meleagris gallopavo TaxID=9103 RepID=A0A803YKY3_MELGA
MVVDSLTYQEAMFPEKKLGKSARCRVVCTKLPSIKKIFVLMGSSSLSSVPGQSIAGVAMNLSAEFTSIPVINGSIVIPCDGFYVVSLKGDFSPDLEKGSLKLMMQNTENKNVATLWERDVQNSSSKVDLITILYLFAENNIILSTSSNATIQNLTFSLVLLNPIFCNS